MMRNPKLGNRNTSLESFEVCTGQKKVVEYVKQILQPKVQGSIFPRDPPYPIFDGLDRLRVRAIFALALGCDALPGGIDGFGASKAVIIRSKIDFRTDPDAPKEELLKHLVDASLKSKPKKYMHVPSGLTREDIICLRWRTRKVQSGIGKGNFSAIDTVTPLGTSKTFLEWLSPFEFATDAAKKARVEPKPQDLGLLREKVPRFESPEKKALKILTKDNMMAIPKQPTGEATDKNPDYLAVQVLP
ncbi:unnamed protein product [Cylindrotheca closterium]|uniref:Uncharacterized protein n=1 Tax=Cylindrotheca closterium TaxID=2856 RepID=A0AAD2FYC6_9STRA|nr:unnamed protein product [Cylindrotheca closterium]